jgi:hypothetical protein
MLLFESFRGLPKIVTIFITNSPFGVLIIETSKSFEIKNKKIISRFSYLKKW